MREKEVNRERGGACSTSYSSGNQVEVLPLVAILEEQYQNSRKKKAGGPHDGTLDHHTHVFEFDCFENCACESRMKFKLCIEASDKDNQTSN